MLPKIVKVGPFDYQLVKDQAAIDRCSAESQEVRLGECDTEKQRITLSPKLAPQMEVDTALHEVLHAISDMVGLASDLGGEVEEKVIRRLSPAILDTLRRNPGFVKYLLET